MADPDWRQLLVDSFRAAVAAADPARVLAARLPPRPSGRVRVVGAGKAAASMARAVEAAWQDVALDGLVVTRYGHGVATRRIQVVEAGHPVPDATGVHAAARMLEMARELGPNDLLLALISGGGSSLLTLPAPGLTVEDVQALNRELLRSGAPITAMNIVRKHVSAISGGQLALASAAPVVALIVSDVTGDDPSAVASGPCAPDASTFADALRVIDVYGIEAPPAIREHLEEGALGRVPETPKPGDPRLAHVENRMIATPHASLVAAARFFEDRGVPSAVLGDTVTGEAREVAKVFAAVAREVRQHGLPWRPPVAILSGGECEVTVARENLQTGRGGRCSEFLLSLAIELDDCPGVHALACDTDGVDGSEDNAGALLAPDTLARARARGIDPARRLSANDAWGFFAALDDLVVTGPTLTNVNDYRVILVL